MGNDVENGLSDVLKMMIRRYCNENPSVEMRSGMHDRIARRLMSLWRIWNVGREVRVEKLR